MKHASLKLSKTWLGLTALLVIALAVLISQTRSAYAQTTNLAAGRTATGSIAIQNAAMITNGDKNTANYAGQEVGVQWIQLDLGANYNLNQINVWHYFGDGRTYRDVIVKVSTSSTFTTSTTVFNNDTNNSAGQGTGSQAEYAETSAGKTITFTPVSARYVRLYSNGSSANGYNHYVEVEVFAGTTPPPTTPPPTTPPPTTPPPTTNLALNRPATSSSNETTSLTPNLAFDGNGGTRWASAYSDPQWIRVDLGSTQNIGRVRLNWEAAYGRSYQIQTSNDGTNWSTIYSTTTGDGGIDDLTGLSGSGRYVRMNGTVRGTAWGYSLWEMEVYGSGGTPPPTTPPPTTPPPTTPPPVSHPANELWDDFSYSGPSDSLLTGNGWVVRNQPNSGPGPAGADFVPGNISFANDPNLSGNRLMQMRVVTNGTGEGTTQAEIYTGTRKYLEGTYAARMYFTDAPISGSYDGDEIVETFFTITPLNFNLDPAYSENDFEYLANGGWGQAGPTMWNTTWETYQADPWIKDGISNFRSGSIQGWHTLVMTVANGHVIYYMDGVQLADHSGKYYPETLMSINFNIWIIPEFFNGSNTTSRTWQQQVDWVYFARNTVLTQAQVNALVADFRATSVLRKNNVP